MKKTICIMPMAGKGERFKKHGILMSKPLINIDGKPMFLKSSQTFSRFKNWIFIAKENFKNQKKFLKSMKSFKKKKILFLKKNTSGQASTIFKAKNLINNNEIVIIHSCDLNFNFNLSELAKKIKIFDILIFTSNSNKFQKLHQKEFSWVRKIVNTNEVEISCKKKFKNSKINNRVLVGSFVFRNKQILINSINLIFKKKLKIKNEYYLDMAAAKSKLLGYKVGEILVKDYTSWGSFNELTNYKNLKK